MILKSLFRTVVYTIIFIATTYLWTGYNNYKMSFGIAIFLFILLSYIINIIIEFITSKLICKFEKTKS